MEQLIYEMGAVRIETVPNEHTVYKASHGRSLRTPSTSLLLAFSRVFPSLQT
jgi:hypothetical protein